MKAKIQLRLRGKPPPKYRLPENSIIIEPYRGIRIKHRKHYKPVPHIRTCGTLKMPALNISEDEMDMVEEIAEQLEVKPTKREVGNEAIRRMYSEVVEKEQTPN